MWTVSCIIYIIEIHYLIIFFTSLADISPEGIETLKRLNVIAAFDFRSDPEVERQGVGP